MGAKPSFVAPSQPLEKSLQELIQGRGCQLDDSELQPFAILICQCIKVYETHITNFYQLASQICQNEFTRVELAGSNFWAEISVWWAVQLCAAKVRSC